MGHIIHDMFHPSDASSKGHIIQEQNFGDTSLRDGLILHPGSPLMGSFTTSYCTVLSVNLDKILSRPILYFPSNHCLWVLVEESVCFGQMFVCTANRFRMGGGGGVKGGGGGVKSHQDIINGLLY